MDAVWMVSLCLTLFIFFIFVLSLKSKPEPEAKEKETSAPATVASSYGGKQLECSEEDMDKFMEKLSRVLFEAETRKRESHDEKIKVCPQDRTEIKFKPREGAEKTFETREPEGRGPRHSQTAYQQSPHKERPSQSDGIEHIMDEIEQAVQETVDSELYMRRRQHQPMARGRHEGQWSKMNVEPEADSL